MVAPIVTSIAAANASPSAYSPPISNRPWRGRTSRPGDVAASRRSMRAGAKRLATIRATSTTMSSGTETLMWVE
jgi:hypothetical protein